METIGISVMVSIGLQLFFFSMVLFSLFFSHKSVFLSVHQQKSASTIKHPNF